ncbi:MAG: hypothetical protein QOJ69_1613, partial [Actinomycetota bacterium]|nr:hypothetical protein [Actinomycetota bacterium]
VKIGRYPLHHGGVAAIRTLGRLGVPVYAITVDRATPAALSHYLRGRFVWPTTGDEDLEALAEGLLDIGDRLKGRVIALPTDDEAAVLLAEHAGRLGQRFEMPDVPPALPRALADKHTLHQLCATHGIASPASHRPESVDDLLEASARIGYPVVLKNSEAWARLRQPAVSSTTVVGSEREMRSLTAAWTTMPHVLVQELLPGDAGSVDWIADVYCGPATDLVFTGVKVRSWPPGAGTMTRGFARANGELAEMTRTFCRAVGFRGLGDLDWRLDPADGRYRLLDFNPRVGAQFRLFETGSGVDVVRAMHLDLTGRPIPSGRQVEGRGLRVENLDIPALWADRHRRPGGRRRRVIPRGTTELAWLAVDDPLPAAAAAIRSGAPAAAMLARRLRRRAGPPAGPHTATPAGSGR